MASLTTALVGPNSQCLAAGPVGGADADSILVVNLDTSNTVNIGTSSTNVVYPLGPLASITLTAPIYAKAATEPLLVGIAPGGTNYSPGSLTITGPVTAEITGPVEVEGSVSIEGTPTVGIDGTVDVAITGTPEVEISGTPDVSISGTVDVQFPTAQDVVVNSGSVEVTNTISTEVTNSPAVTVTSGSVTVAGEVNIGNSPAVTIESGAVTATISGTPTIQLESGSEIEISNATIDVSGVGGYVLPGQLGNLLLETNKTLAAGATSAYAQFSVANYQSLDLFIQTSAGVTTTNAAYCLIVSVTFTDSVSAQSVDFYQFGSLLGNGVTVTIPCSGNDCTVEITNIGSAGTISGIDLSVTGSFRQVPGFTWGLSGTALFTPVNDSTITWGGTIVGFTSGPGGLSFGSFGGSTSLLGFVMPPAQGLVTGYYQVNDSAGTGFANDPGVLDMTYQVRGGIAAGAGNMATFINVPKAIPSPNVPTQFSLNFPVCFAALILKSANTTANLQFVAIQS